MISIGNDDPELLEMAYRQAYPTLNTASTIGEGCAPPAAAVAIGGKSAPRMAIVAIVWLGEPSPVGGRHDACGSGDEIAAAIQELAARLGDALRQTPNSIDKRAA
jgi:hypothetical protein